MPDTASTAENHCKQFKPETVIGKTMKRTLFHIPKMDCPTEASMVRIKLEEVLTIRKLEFDFQNRMLTVFHEADDELIENLLDELKLGSVKKETGFWDQSDIPEESTQRKTLWIVLIINFSFFVIELTTGLISKSMGLVADSLDMLADAFVYAISLYAVGGTMVRKKKVARMAGYFQIFLALIGFVEILRRFIGAEKMPDFSIMIIVSSFALIANAICLYLLYRVRSKEAHMQASMIFTSNDIAINLGVIIAGLMVFWLDSGIPDLVIGSIVFLIVIRGAIHILRLGK
jgi:Co/Zn/Cd efflux system component